MCRLFGLSAANGRVHATFWLLEAPDSLAAQSHREPDGTGLGTFDEEGRAHVNKQPMAAFADRAFATEARRACSRTFVAHVRFASTGDLTLVNTHPFCQDGRLFAHNGVIEDSERIIERAGDAAALIEGQTDSERFFALITAEARRRDGDLDAAIEAAVDWVADTLPILSLNFVLTTSERLWALRYPDAHDLFILEREAGGHRRDEALEHRSSLTTHVHSEELRDSPAVVVATERTDDDPDWRALRSGELVRVDQGGHVVRRIVRAAAPAHPLSLADLDPRARSSQQPAPAASG